MKEFFYFPLKAFQEDEDYEDMLEVDQSTIVAAISAIDEDLVDYQSIDGDSMLDYFDEDENLKNKMTSMKWGACVVDDKPYGYVEIGLTEPLTEKERRILSDWIEGQNSDGLGEGFEQQSIDTPYGDIYVSMWSYDNDYKILTQEELDEIHNRYSINLVEPQDLRHMKGKEGLVLQGCGGSLADWIVGINKELTEQGILKNGTRFKEVYSFKNENLTNLVYPFDDKVDLDMGKLAMWRIATHEQFGGTWLSDYVDNHLDGFIEDTPAERIKPDCPLIGQDGNIFNLMGIASRTLRQNGLADEAKEMCDRITQSGSYYEALGVIGEYVNITSIDEDMDDGMGGM